MSKISLEAFNRTISEELPLAADTGVYLRKIEPGKAEMVLPYSDRFVRPGGTIAGPFMMLLADVCMYGVAMSLIGEREVDLGNITIPVLNVYATQDHLVPPDASRALAGLAGSKDYTELSFPGGHIGIYVSGKAQATVTPAISEWLNKRC